jgi:hypothetical protein
MEIGENLSDLIKFIVSAAIALAVVWKIFCGNKKGGYFH